MLIFLAVVNSIFMSLVIVEIFKRKTTSEIAAGGLIIAIFALNLLNVLNQLFVTVANP